MDDRVIQFRVGVLVVASAIITAILAMLFFREAVFLGPRRRTIVVKFPEAPGVTVDTPVRKSGILIGRVSKVEFGDEDGVYVTARIDASRSIRRSEICRINSSSLFGDAVLEFVQGSGPQSKELLTGEQIVLEGHVQSDPLESLQKVMTMLSSLETDVAGALRSVEGAGESIQSAGEDVSSVARRLDQFLEDNGDRVGSMLARTEQSLDKLDGAMGQATDMLSTVNQFLGDDANQQSMQNAVRQIPLVLQDARDLLSGLQRVSNQAEMNLDNLQGLTAPLGEKGPEIVAAFEQGIGRMDELVDEVIAVTQAVRNGQGTVGQLLHNPELYQRLNRSVQNIEELTVLLRPVVDDVRIITDKVARDPAQMGVKGILDRRASGLKMGIRPRF